jgi:hypothetical protein
MMTWDVQEYVELNKAGKKDQAFAMLTPESAARAAAIWAAKRWHGDYSRPEDPVLVSPTTARVTVWVNLPRDQRQPGLDELPASYFFQLADTRHLIDNRGPSYQSLPIGALYVFDPDRAPDPTKLAHDPQGTKRVKEELRAFSRQWPGGDPDPWKWAQNVQTWWAEQSARFGKDAEVANLFKQPRFIGMEGTQAVCEMPVYFADPRGGLNRVTYRFVTVQDPTDSQNPPDQWDCQWKIADVCVWKAEKTAPEEDFTGAKVVPVPGVAAPVGAPGGPPGAGGPPPGAAAP